MKIAFYSADVGNHRFITPILERLQQKGYECQLYNNWHIDDTADIIFFDFCDNNLISASRDDKEFLKSKKVIARLHAVERYHDFHHQIDWSTVGDLIFVSDHMKRMCNQDGELPVRQHVIHNPINLSEWDYKERSGAKIFSYVGNIVPTKGLLTFLHYFSAVRSKDNSAEFHLAGLSRFHGREGEYWENSKKTIGNIFEEPSNEDINKWLEDKNTDIVVQPSYAESFSLIIAEAMAKGYKVAINNFYGAEELWPKDLIYSNWYEFLKILEAPYESQKYRDWVYQKYNLDDIMKKIEVIINA
jgi:glycosyltransferase involved in cell wall biosynthesis